MLDPVVASWWFSRLSKSWIELPVEILNWMSCVSRSTCNLLFGEPEAQNQQKFAASARKMLKIMALKKITRHVIILKSFCTVTQYSFWLTRCNYSKKQSNQKTALGRISCTVFFCPSWQVTTLHPAHLLERTALQPDRNGLSVTITVS